MKARLPLIAALAVALFPLKASAQAWLASPDFSEGIGLRAGNLEFHPGVGAEFGYDSNFYRASEAEGPVEVLKLRVTPSVSLTTLGSQRRNATTPPNFVFSAGTYASFFQLFPLDSADTNASKRRNVNLGADLRLDVFPHRKVGFDLLANYRRITDEGEGRTDDLAGQGFDRDTVRAGGGITWRPGGGLFEWRAGYLGQFNYFENESYRTYGNLQHQVELKGRWRFLPRSALLSQTSYSFVRYTDNNTQQTDGDIMRTHVGIHSLVTYHLALMGMVGWAASFYEPRPGAIAPRQFDSITANAEARWFIQARPNLEDTTIASGLSSVAVGYNRSFNNSYYGSFYQRDRGYVQFSMFLLGALAGGLEFGISRVAYPDVTVGAFHQDSVSQLRLDSQVFAEYRMTDILALNATVSYDQVNSPRVNNEDLEYKRFQAYVGMRLFW
jgi:hypothetical protein